MHTALAATPLPTYGTPSSASSPCIIRPRLEHLFGEVGKALEQLGFPRGRQVVLTGGGAELKGVADYAQGLLGRSVRVGRPRGLAGLPDAHSGPAFATLAGLTRYAASDPLDLRAAPIERGQQVIRPSGSALIQRLVTAFRTNL